MSRFGHARDEGQNRPRGTRDKALARIQHLREAFGCNVERDRGLTTMCTARRRARHQLLTFPGAAQ